MSANGPINEWQIGADGLPGRAAARVLLFDSRGRVLLIRAHDAGNPTRSWWFTLGGGIDTGEGERQAATREVAEECGLALLPEELIGPVARRDAIFDFAAGPVRQREVFFVARLGAAEETELQTAGWTQSERDFLDELRWFSPAELARLEGEVFPAELRSLVSSCWPAWDGQIRQLIG